MKILFTSDTFFGRRLAAVERGFQEEEEMLDSYIQKWNDRVGKNDIVYHLGNFGWDPISTESAMIHLKGKINFIQGSYDSHLTNASLVKTGRHTVLQNQIAIIPTHEIIVSHWPLLDWPGKSEGAIHVHGGEEKTSIEKGNRFNVNIKNWKSVPIELEFLQEVVQSHNTQN
jgi:calcineurin-like phosphoesterase family protein